MTDLRYSTGTELFEFLYAKCREDHDLLAMIVDEYIVSLSLNQDVCIYNSWEDQHIQLDVDLAFTTDECDVLDVDHPVIRF